MIPWHKYFKKEFQDKVEAAKMKNRKHKIKPGENSSNQRVLAGWHSPLTENDLKVANLVRSLLDTISSSYTITPIDFTDHEAVPDDDGSASTSSTGCVSSFDSRCTLRESSPSEVAHESIPEEEGKAESEEQVEGEVSNKIGKTLSGEISPVSSCTEVPYETEQSLVTIDKSCHASSLNLSIDQDDEYTELYHRERESEGSSRTLTYSVLLDRSVSDVSEEQLEAEESDHSESKKALVCKTRVSDDDVNLEIFLSNGNYFQGRISLGLMEGKGFYKWNSGSHYIGYFREGKIDGIGYLTKVDSYIHIGNFENGVRHGSGFTILLPEHKKIYLGMWKDGFKEGKGYMVYDENKWYEGEWFNDKPHGYGQRRYKNGTYTGFWKNGERHGKGIMVWDNRDMYCGDWVDGMMHGVGKYYWNASKLNVGNYPPSDYYYGQWAQGFRHGLGVQQYYTGTVIVTKWDMGFKRGAAYIIGPNGKIISGPNIFKHDMFDIDSLEKAYRYTRFEELNSIISIVFKNEEIRPLPNSIMYMILMDEFLQCRKLDAAEIQEGHYTCQCTDDAVQAICAKTHCMSLTYHIHKVIEAYEQERLRLVEDWENNLLNINEFYQDSNYLSKLAPSSASVKSVFTEDIFWSKERIQTLLKRLWGAVKEYHSIDISLAEITDLFKRRLYCFPGLQSVDANLKPVFDIDSAITLFLQNTVDSEAIRLAAIKQCFILNFYERYCLRKILISRMPELRKVYEKYANIHLCHPDMKFKPGMIKLRLWAMLRDVGFYYVGESLVDFDDEMGSTGNPFAFVPMWEMVHYLVGLTWKLYGQEMISGQKIPGILASIFERFIVTHIIPNLDEVSTSLKICDGLQLLPLQTIYELYQSFGPPKTLTAAFLLAKLKPIKPKRPIPPFPTEQLCSVMKAHPSMFPENYKKLKQNLLKIHRYILTFDPNNLKVPYHEKIKFREAMSVFRGISNDRLKKLMYISCPPMSDPTNKTSSLTYSINFNEFCDIYLNASVMYLRSRKIVSAQSYVKHMIRYMKSIKKTKSNFVNNFLNQFLYQVEKKEENDSEPGEKHNVSESGTSNIFITKEDSLSRILDELLKQ